MIETALGGAKFDGTTHGLTQEERLMLSEEAIARTGGADNYWSYLQDNPDAVFSVAIETFYLSDDTRLGARYS